MTLLEFLDTTKLPSINPVVEPDYNKLTVDNFDMISHDHLIGEQLNFLVDHIVSTIFEDKIYMDEWKSKFSSLLSEHYCYLLMDEELPTQQELLAVLAKGDTLIALRTYVKCNLEKTLSRIEVAPIMERLIAEMRESNEDQRRRPTVPT